MTDGRRFADLPSQPVWANALPNADAEDDIIDLRGLFWKVWRGKWIILVCTLLAGTFGYLTTTQYDPVYRAEATVMFDVAGTTSADVEELLTGNNIRDRSLVNQVEVLQSKTLIRRVVEKLSLVDNPEFNRRLATREPTWRDHVPSLNLVPDYVKEVAQNMGLIDPPPEQTEEMALDPEVQAERDQRAVVQRILSGLELEPVEFSRVIRIGFVAENPSTASSVANAIAEQYIGDQLEAKLEASRAAAEWLAERVQELQEQVQTAETAIKAARAQQVAVGSQSLEITNQQLQAVSASLALARSEARSAEANYNRIRDAVRNNDDFGAVPDFRASSRISRLLEDESELLIERAILLQTDASPLRDVAEFNIRLESVRQRMRDEALRIVEVARVDWQSARTRQSSLEVEAQDLESLADQQSESEGEIRALEREAEAGRILYGNFLARLKETSEERELTSADARILSAAEPPLSSLRLAENRTQMISLIVGAAAGLGLVFLIDAMNNTFRTVALTEEVTGKTVLGEIPTLGSHIRRRAVLKDFREHPKSGLAEAVRNLRTSILFSNVDAPPRVVMFTSSLPREGKSTTATLVALASQQMGQRAVIVDCDLRLPALAEILEAKDDAPGLLTAVEGTVPLEECIHQDEKTGLHVLMTMPSEPRSTVNAADILSSQRFSALMEQLKGRYDRVILDTPPVLAVADPRILSAYADAVIYVIQWDNTARGAVLEGLKELEMVKAPISGLVLTQVNEEKASRYAYHGYSYYKGRYHSYSAE